MAYVKSPRDALASPVIVDPTTALFIPHPLSRSGIPAAVSQTRHVRPYAFGQRVISSSPALPNDIVQEHHPAELIPAFKTAKLVVPGVLRDGYDSPTFLHPVAAKRLADELSWRDVEPGVRVPEKERGARVRQCPRGRNRLERHRARRGVSETSSWRSEKGGREDEGGSCEQTERATGDGWVSWPIILGGSS